MIVIVRWIRAASPAAAELGCVARHNRLPLGKPACRRHARVRFGSIGCFLRKTGFCVFWRREEKNIVLAKMHSSHCAQVLDGFYLHDVLQ